MCRTHIMCLTSPILSSAASVPDLVPCILRIKHQHSHTHSGAHHREGLSVFEFVPNLVSDDTTPKATASSYPHHPCTMLILRKSIKHAVILHSTVTATMGAVRTSRYGMSEATRWSFPSAFSCHQLQHSRVTASCTSWQSPRACGNDSSTLQSVIEERDAEQLVILLK